MRERQHMGTTMYFVKDPLTLRYYRFAPAEFQLFELLDGRRTLDDLQDVASRESLLRTFCAADLLPLIQRWQKAGLLREPADLATARILAARQQSHNGRWLRQLSSILYLKVHAFDPDRLLNGIYPCVRWLFQPVGILLAAAVMALAVLLVASRFDEFTSRPELQNLQAFFTVQNIVWLWLAVGIVKVLHEFGHGLTCKHFGGECHAMGLLFLCFTPCLYCDVSDSWMLPSKWHRIAIAAAGIYVELIVAAVATFVWWSTVPGVLHSIAFSAMLFGSVQTLLLNANPLMRFDGYYMLSDYLEVPNLRQKSYAFTLYHLKQWFWGTREPAPAGGPGFAVYAVTASVYRVLLTAGMIWFFSQVLEPYKLAAVGWLLAGLAVTNLVVLPVGQGLAAAVRHPAGLRPVSWWRPGLAVALLAALAAAFWYLPLPRRAYAVLTLEPASSEVVSPTTRGRLVAHHVRPGQRVRRGDPLVELDNAELRLQRQRLEQQCDLLRVKSRAASAVLDPARAQSIQVALAELESQLSLFQQRIDDLVLRAPCAGEVIPGPERDPTAIPPRSAVTPLGGWTRSLLHPENIGAVLEPGTAVCQIADTGEFVAVAILSQSQIEPVQTGQAAAIKLDAFPAETFLGTVRDISVQEVDQAAPQLLNLNGSELPAFSSGPQAGRLAETHYRVRLQLTGLARGELAPWPNRFKSGLRGRAWIRIGSQTPAQATWQWICQVLQR